MTPAERRRARRAGRYDSPWLGPKLLWGAGLLLAVVRVGRRWRSSIIVQHIAMTHASRRIDFQTEIDWHESHVLLKAAFAVAVRAPVATYEIQFGHVERPTHRNTRWDAARFEVRAHRWADLSEADHGVALLNDGRYGHDVRGHTMRLSLVKSTTMPDPDADQGRHAFTYALLPHVGDWRPDVPAEAYALNHPVHATAMDGTVPASPDAGALVRCASPNVVINTIKPAGDGDGVVVRLYEAWRSRGGPFWSSTPSSTPSNDAVCWRRRGSRSRSSIGTRR